MTEPPKQKQKPGLKPGRKPINTKHNLIIESYTQGKPPQEKDINIINQFLKMQDIIKNFINNDGLTGL